MGKSKRVFAAQLVFNLSPADTCNTKAKNIIGPLACMLREGANASSANQLRLFEPAAEAMTKLADADVHNAKQITATDGVVKDLVYVLNTRNKPSNTVSAALSMLSSLAKNGGDTKKIVEEQAIEAIVAVLKHVPYNSPAAQMATIALTNLAVHEDVMQHLEHFVNQKRIVKKKHTVKKKSALTVLVQMLSSESRIIQVCITT